MGGEMIGGTFVVVFMLYLGTGFVAVRAQLNICPVQGLNRTLQPGYPLIQCFPFFEGGACCQRHEEQAVFNKFDELRFTGSDNCIALMSNLLCYICSPDQANWYSNNKVKVCAGFCDHLWNHCASATFGITQLTSLYQNGRDFCDREGFLVQGNTNRSCYNVHSSLASTGGTATLKISGMLISCAVFVIYTLFL